MGAAEIVAIAGVVAVILWSVWTRRTDRKLAEKQAAEHLVAWLIGKRVLWTPIVNEIPHEVIASVAAIRERIDNDYGSFSAPKAQEALDSIRSACLVLLDEPRERWRGYWSAEARSGLYAFRGQVRPCVETLVRAHKIGTPQWPEYRGGFEGPGKKIKVAPAPRGGHVDQGQ